MDSKILVTANLSGDMEKIGAELVSKLDRRIKVSLALWMKLPTSYRWRFVIGSPDARTDGPRKVYRTIQTVAQKMPMSIDISDISVIDDRNPMYIAFSGFIKTDPKGIGRFRFTDVMFDGLHVSDALVYRAS